MKFLQILLFFPILAFPQKDARVLYNKEVDREKLVTMLRYVPPKAKKPVMLSYTPRRINFLNFLKITMKPGLNQQQLSRVNTTAIMNRDLTDAFDDVNFVFIAKYEFRVKIYTGIKSRIIVRMLVAQPMSTYTIGLRYKI